ncbi:anthranilate phosphoribosyltransferase [Eisenibacter elegans]|uniref:anthranilate phosphoribosyltransferase n=1 Tax=Eisenibacter elegans TaxID=997 RepID=UPI000412BB90|nr:anthranilate phosphoribosyltransferase [Eisenibacter elegans]
MKALLNRLFNHETLTKAEAAEVLTHIAQGAYNPAQIASFITVYLMRSITVEELDGFREAMLALCVPAPLSDYRPIDLCGTGGDGKDTFNISTLASFVVAASGVAVAKHGNYGVSSISGSSTVLEYFGVKFSNDADQLRRQMDATGLCFLHAPLFHPALKNVGPIRKELGIKTFFNMLGPMVNPAAPPYQLVGVFSAELARLYAYLYQQTNKRFSILHSLDGYDEISLTGAFKWLSNEGERILEPDALGMPQYRPEDLFGGATVADAAAIFAQVLQGQGTAAQTDAVVANAGMAIHCARPDTSLLDCLTQARESLLSGQALQTFERFVALAS